jgi:hypothetical protein
MKLHAIVLFLLMTTLLCACNDNRDSWADNYQMAFMDMMTNGSGQTYKAVNDEGETLSVINPIGGLTNDTTYRFIVVFVREGNSIRLSSYSHTISGKPFKMEEETAITDPVTVQSIWKTSNYINATFLIQKKTEQHVMDFIDKGVTTNNQGTRIARVQLYHDNSNDAEAFTATAYASLPLWAYRDRLERGRDSVYFIVNTTDSLAIYPFLY